MEKLREAVIKLASAKQKEPLSSSQIALIDRCLHESFPLGLHVPSHPLYSSMVRTAITELNQADGSSEHSIREYIKAKYEDLPWAHKSILRHHLNRLCDEGFILLVASDRYTIPGFTPKRIFTRGRVKGKQVVKRRVICPENSEKNGVQRQGRLSRKEELTSAFEENKEFVGLDNGNGIEDEPVTNECRSLVVAEDKEEKTVQEEDHESEVLGKGEDLEKQNSLITRPSIPKVVKLCRRKNKTKRDQLLAEEKSLVVCSSVDERMNNASVENVVKKKKKNVENPLVDRAIVCALGAKSPKPAESGRPVTRQSKNLTISPVSKSPIPKLQKQKSLQPVSIVSGQGAKVKEAKRNWPSWVPLLLKTDLNSKCKIHADVEKNIYNLYCSDCKIGALCTSCVASHEGHHVIKIKQAGFEGPVVDVSDIDKHIDIKDIRTNKESSTVTTIVLKSAPTWKSAAKNNPTSCVYCKNRVPYPNKFCSLSCKFEHEQLSAKLSGSTHCKINLGNLDAFESSLTSRKSRRLAK